MNWVHAFCCVWAAVTMFDLIVFILKKVPKASVFYGHIKGAWTTGIVAAVFELGWWFF